MSSSNKKQKAQKNTAKQSEPAPAPASTKPTSRLFYLVIVLVPVLFFIILEIGLRVFNYGNDYTMWVTPVDKATSRTIGEYSREAEPSKKVLILNPDIARKYFSDVKHIPQSDGDAFEKIKGPHTFRVFVLGGSAAAGFPFLPNGSFSRYLQQRLSLEYPDSKIEVVNCAMTAINSYSLLDFMPGILREKPDLIIIYAGNNEYYGALGVGSLESFGTSRDLVNLVIYLERFRTFQLLQNIIKGVSRLFASKSAPSGTLMSRMARNQYITLGSKVYWEGVSQFRGNMTDILQMAKDHHVPVLLGTLACNLRNQYPFVSVKANGLPPADSVFVHAQRALAAGNIHAADSLFRYAKNLDALRFRPPTAINDAITELGHKFGDPVVNVDSAFNALSPDHVVGNNLMTDHLHPTLRGYEIMGRLYYDEMQAARLLPGTEPLGLTDKQQDSITVADFPFCRLDSVISRYIILKLKNDWPYVKDPGTISYRMLFHPTDYIDSLAYREVTGDLGWEEAHKEASLWYAERGDMNAFARIMDVLVNQYPYSLVNYDYAISVLLKAKQYDKAYYFLTERNRLQPDAFCEKWLGAIDLVQSHFNSALSHLQESARYNDGDAQVWYYMAEALVEKKEYDKAYQAVGRAVAIQPHFAEALKLEAQLKAMFTKK